MSNEPVELFQFDLAIGELASHPEYGVPIEVEGPDAVAWRNLAGLCLLTAEHGHLEISRLMEPMLQANGPMVTMRAFEWSAILVLLHAVISNMERWAEEPATSESFTTQPSVWQEQADKAKTIFMVITCSVLAKSKATIDVIFADPEISTMFKPYLKRFIDEHPEVFRVHE